ncbi:MAG TPA: TonB family protein [Candidatus Sulfotelmatobacter sp.]|nr:TonB family protein [Candidatus Sulfotelmatobacter sp.]
MSKPDTWKSWEGLVIKGKYPLRQWLGGSDHSAVFLTEFADQHSQRAAIKLIQVDEGNAETRLSRLRAAAKLSHPHLIRMFECGLCRLDGSPFVYVLMECADDDLSRILPERPLDPSEVSDLLPPVLDALSYLHKNGFVHGRVKPSNVLAAGDQLKLSSDQVAPVVQQDGGRRRRDVYDAPETAAGIISPAGDIWSAGVTLLAALAQNVTAAEQASPANRDLPETIPDPFRGIVRECLQLDPNRRCSLKEIQARMQPAARSVPAPPEPVSVPASSSSRRPVFAVAAVAIIVLGTVLALLYSRSSKSSTATTGATKQPVTEPVPAPTSAPPKPAEPVTPTPASVGEVVRQVLPDVPRSAQNTIRGTIKVVVRVQVDPSGKVTAAKLKSSGSSRYFANQALKAAERWEFSAPEVGGQPTTSTWLLQFRFKRTSIQASPQRVKG